MSWCMSPIALSVLGWAGLTDRPLRIDVQAAAAGEFRHSTCRQQHGEFRHSTDSQSPAWGVCKTLCTHTHSMHRNYMQR